MGMNKIRLWDKIERRMIYAEEAQKSANLLAIGLHGLPIAVDRDSFRDNEIVGWNVDHRYVPMQYIGHPDKNGRDIYEGDIVRWSAYPSNPNVRAYRRVVQWSDTEARFKPDSMGDDPVVEIIGNIYDNPDLLPK